MSVLSAFSVEELEREISERKNNELKAKVSAIYSAIQEAENVAVEMGLDFQLNLGSELQITFDSDHEDWSYS